MSQEQQVEFSVQIIGDALQVLFQKATTSPEDWKRANHILEECQKKPEAWELASQLLMVQSPVPGWQTHCALFGAQTLRVKVMRDFKQLPPAARNALKESLLAHMERLHNSDSRVLTQLALSLASLGVVMADEWENIVLDVVNRYTIHQETLPCLLEVLCVLPEEVDNPRLVVDRALKNRCKDSLDRCFPTVLNLLAAFLQSTGTNAQAQIKVFRCFLSWLRFGFKSVDSNVLVSNPLLIAPFEALRAPALFEVAADVILELIHESADFDNHIQLVNFLIPRILALAPLFDEAVRKKDSDVTRRLSAIFTEACEVWLPLITDIRDQILIDLVSVLIRCTAESMESAEITFNFWHLLCKELIDSTKERSKEPKEVRQEKEQLFFPLLSQLFEILRGLLRFPVNQQMPADQLDDFKSFRYEVGDVLKAICCYLGDTRCLDQTFRALQAQLVLVPTGTYSWQDVEASLYTFRSIARYVSSNETTIMPQFMKLIPVFPPHPQIRYTAALNIGRYAEWLDRHPEYLPSLLDYLKDGLHAPEVWSAASLAFKYLGQICYKSLLPLLPGLLSLYDEVLPMLAPGDQRELVECLGHVISKTRGEPAKTAACRLALPFLTRLQVLLSASPNGSKAWPEISSALYLLTNVFQFLTFDTDSNDKTKEEHPCFLLVDRSWPLIQALFATPHAIEHIGDRLARCCKYAVRCTYVHFSPFLPTLVNLILHTYQHTHLSSFLQTANEIVRTFPAQLPGLTEMLVLSSLLFSISKFALTEMTSSWLAKHEHEQFTKFPDIIEDYFELVTTFLEKNPLVFFQLPIFLSIFSFGVAALGVQHTEALKMVLQFFKTLVKMAVPHSEPTPEAQFLQPFLLQHGTEVARGLLCGVVGPITSYCIPEIANVFKYLVDFNRAEVQKWVQRIFTENFPNEVMKEEDKESLLDTIFTSSNRDLKENIFNAFNEFYDNYRRPPS